MSHDFLNPPCKRFGGTHYDNTGYNIVRAHQSLQTHGCSRMQSIKFLSRTNCKMDSSLTTVGPKQHSVLRLRHNKHLCISGWDFGEKLYDTQEPNRDSEIEMIRTGDEIMQKLEQYDDKIRDQNLYNFGHQQRFLQIVSEQLKLPEDRNAKMNKVNYINIQILALKKQMRRMHKVNQETLNRMSQQEQDLESQAMNASSRLMSPTKHSTYQQYSERDSIIQHCDSQNYSSKGDSPNLKIISDFKNKVFGNYIKRVSKQNSQPILLNSQKSFRNGKPLNLLLNSGIQLRESKTRTMNREKSYYSRNVFFPTESTLPKHNSSKQSQYQL